MTTAGGHIRHLNTQKWLLTLTLHRVYLLAFSAVVWVFLFFLKKLGVVVSGGVRLWFLLFPFSEPTISLKNGFRRIQGEGSLVWDGMGWDKEKSVFCTDATAVHVMLWSGECEGDIAVPLL